jgi:iduronate 2-sulfatase
MTKTLIRFGVCLALAILAFSSNGATLSQPARKPNVLFIIADDLRTELGCYGSQVATTPNLNRLAKRGMRFDAAYCQYPVCNPSRTSLLTGLRPDTTRVLDNNLNFRTTLPNVVTLPQLFRQNGYRATSFGKIFHRGLTMEDLRTDMDDKPSWDEVRYFQTTPPGFKGEGRNLTDGKLAWCNWRAAEGTDEDQPDGQIAHEAINVLEQHAGQKNAQPFFLALGFHKPHDPFIAPKKYFDLYPPESLKLWQAPTVTLADPAVALPGGAFREAFAKFSDKERREFMRAYLAGVSFTDAQVGKVLDALDRLKLIENTIIIFLGDHGYHLGERGWWNKSTLFELSARAPMMVYTPRMKAKGKATARLVEFIDIYPTLIELAGLKTTNKLEGRSFVPLLDNPQLKWKEAAYTQVQRGRLAGHSVRTERWRYTEWDKGRQGVELYDHQTDPNEYRNLANDPKHKVTVERLKGLLRKE